MSVPSPHFQSNRTGVIYSHNGMMDYPRIPITEWNLGNFPDSVEFQCWKVNLRTEVCLKTADPQITMLWIKEVEIVKSIDELVTSRSIMVKDFPDFDVLGAKIVSALKKLLNTQSHIRRRVSVEEQRAQNSDRFLRGSISVQPEFVKRYKDSQIGSIYVCRMTMFKISTSDVIMLYFL